MNRLKLWAALFAALLLAVGCKDFFHPEGPTKVPGPHPATDEEAAEIFRESETIKEALEIEVTEINLDVSAEDLVDLEAKIDAALAAYDKLSQGARAFLPEKRPNWTRQKKR
jgi:hypothetical protein